MTPPTLFCSCSCSVLACLTGWCGALHHNCAPGALRVPGQHAPLPQRPARVARHAGTSRFLRANVCLVQPHAATCAVLVVLFRSCFCTTAELCSGLEAAARAAHRACAHTGTTEIQQGYSSRAPTLPATLPWPCLTRVARGAACVSPPPRHAEPRPAGRSRCVLAKPPPPLRACAVVAARHHWLRLVSAWAMPFPSQPP